MNFDDRHSLTEESASVAGGFVEHRRRCTTGGKFRRSSTGKVPPSLQVSACSHGRHPPNMSTETWLPVVGFEGLYSISSLGSVRSEARKVTDKNGIVHSVAEKILSAPANAGGYPRVNLARDGFATKTVYVHDLVTEAFRGPKPPGLEVRHRDDVKTNNSVSNLFYGTRSENQRDAVANGRNWLANRSACKWGHEFNRENTTFEVSRPTVRLCLTCRRNNARRRTLRNSKETRV